MAELKFFLIPVYDPEPAEQALNRFLRAHRVLAVDRQLVTNGSGSAWSVCVPYEASAGAAEAKSPVVKTKVDDREVLEPAEFVCFAKLRELRKAIADNDKIPACTVFTNEQLAAMVRARAKTKAEMTAIEGVGDARVQKYAEAFLSLLRPWSNDAGADSAAAVSPGA